MPDNSYNEIKHRLIARLNEQQLPHNFVVQVQEAFELSLAREAIILSRPERQLLFKAVFWEILTGLIEEYT